MDRILEAELAVEQKTDQGVEGPGGTGGSGSSVSDGVTPSLRWGWGRRKSRSVLSPLFPSPHTLLTLLGTGSAAKQGLSNI